VKKGIILEQYENYSILFCEDGSFVNIPSSINHTEVGTEIYYRSRSSEVSIPRKRRKGSWTESFQRLVVIMGMLVVSFTPVYTYSERNKFNPYLHVETLPRIEFKH